MDELNIRELLDTPITDADGVARWTDSICNASVPLPREDHTGVLPPLAGVHGYPSPVTEIQLFEFDWFDLWHYSDATQEVIAATPVVATDAGNEGTRAIFAAPVVATDAGNEGTRAIFAAPVVPTEPVEAPAGAFVTEAVAGEVPELIFPPDHPFSQQAFQAKPPG